MNYTLNPGSLIREGVEDTLLAIEQLLLNGAPQVCIQQKAAPTEVGSRTTPHSLELALDSCTVSVVLNTRPNGIPMGYGEFLRVLRPSGAYWAISSAGTDTALILSNESTCVSPAWVTPAGEFLLRVTLTVDNGSNHAVVFTDYNTGVLTVGNLSGNTPGPHQGLLVGAIQPLDWTVLIREVSIWGRSFTINEWLANTQPPQIQFSPDGVGPNGWVSSSGGHTFSLGE